MTADLDSPGSLAAQELAALEELAALKERLAKIRGRGIAQYVHDPLGFIGAAVKFKPGGGLAPYQAEIIADLPRVKRIAVRGPRGLGKSALVSLIVLWFALTRDAAGIDWKIGTTAGSWAQLESYLWPEITKWSNHLNWTVIGREPLSPRSELMKTQMRLRHGLALAASPEKPAVIEGLHADSVLIVIDEAKIVNPGIFDSIEGAFSGAGDGSDLEAYALAFSTPGEPAGRFYDIHARKPGLEDWQVRHVTLDEAIAAGRMTRQWAAQRMKLWGENSALYQNHVLGEFCADDEDAVIPLRWIEAAFERWRQAVHGPPRRLDRRYSRSGGRRDRRRDAAQGQERGGCGSCSSGASTAARSVANARRYIVPGPHDDGHRRPEQLVEQRSNEHARVQRRRRLLSERTCTSGRQRRSLGACRPSEAAGR